MTINLTPQQIAWLQSFAAERGFASIDEAAQFVMAEAMQFAGMEEPDPAEIMTLLEEADRDFAEGRTISGEDFRAHLQARVKGFGG
jgi:hypothetical protein